MVSVGTSHVTFLVSVEHLLCTLHSDFVCLCKRIFSLSISEYRAVVPKGGGGITEVGANGYDRWKGALLLSQGGVSRQAVHLVL